METNVKLGEIDSKATDALIAELRDRKIDAIPSPNTVEETSTSYDLRQQGKHAWVTHMASFMHLQVFTPYPYYAFVRGKDFERTYQRTFSIKQPYPG